MTNSNLDNVKMNEILLEYAEGNIGWREAKTQLNLRSYDELEKLFSESGFVKTAKLTEEDALNAIEVLSSLKKHDK